MGGGGGKVKYKLRVMSYGFKSTTYEFKSTSYETKSTSCKIKRLSWEIKGRVRRLKGLVETWNYNTIIRTGIACTKVPCYMRNSACRWLIVENAKIF